MAGVSLASDSGLDTSSSLVDGDFEDDSVLLPKVEASKMDYVVADQALLKTRPKSRARSTERPSRSAELPKPVSFARPKTTLDDPASEQLFLDPLFGKLGRQQ